MIIWWFCWFAPQWQTSTLQYILSALDQENQIRWLHWLTVGNTPVYSAQGKTLGLSVGTWRCQGWSEINCALDYQTNIHFFLFHRDLRYKIPIRLETPDWAESDNCQLCNKWDHLFKDIRTSDTRRLCNNAQCSRCQLKVAQNRASSDQSEWSILSCDFQKYLF